MQLVAQTEYCKFHISLNYKTVLNQHQNANLNIEYFNPIRPTGIDDGCSCIEK
jgi:hypothetical protein